MERVDEEIRIADMIAKKWLSKEALTDEEERLLSTWLNKSGDNKTIYEKYMNELPYDDFEEITKMVDPGGHWMSLDHLTRPQWGVERVLRVCVAAGVALLVALSAWVVVFEREKEISVMCMSVIPPGTKQAVLILADGQQIGLGKKDTLVNTVYSDIKIETGEVRYDMKEVKLVEEMTVAYNKIVVPRGGIYSLVLGDGTRVFMNSESELRYPVRFTDSLREVSLTGEAFFEVAHDSTRPFIVNAGGMHTRVLGTTFNILAYTDEPTVRMTLLSGRVEVSVDGLLLKKVLCPGEQVSWRCGSGEISVRKVDVGIQALWKDGVIVLVDDELEGVMRMLSRWYNVIYEFKGDRGMKHTFTGKIDRNEDLESVLKTLTLLGGPRFEIVGKKVYVY